MKRALTQRCSALVALAAYAFAALVVPVLHARHHALHGAEHLHTATGTVYFAPTDEPHDASFHHAAFDADLAALDLAEVAHAGTLSVDCSLAGYTLAACDGSLPADHPHGFGDELLASHHHHAPPIDPWHGAGALEHLHALTLTQPPFLLPPPLVPSARLPHPLPLRSFSVEKARTVDARGPPPSLVTA